MKESLPHRPTERPEESVDAVDDGLGEPARLKSTIMSGSHWLLFRMLAGIVISGVGLIVIAQLLGPTVYGLYSTAFVIWFLAQNVSELNLDVWIVRRRRAQEAQALRVAMLLILVFSTIGGVVLAAAAPLAADLANLPDLVGVLRVLAPVIVVAGLGQPALSSLERDLRFQAVGLVEVGGQIAFYMVAIFLALLGVGLYSLVWALAVQQTMLTVTFMVIARTIPCPGWDRALARSAISFGVVATSSSLLENGRTFILQLLVARYAGAAGAGYYALAVRVLEQASFVRHILYRLSVALFGRLRDDRDRLVSALNKSLLAQILAMAPILLLIALLGPWLFPLLFGEQWRPVAVLLPLLIPTYLVMMTGRLHQSALLATDRTVPVALTTGAYVALLAVFAIPAISQFGPAGVAIAEAVGSAAIFVTMYLFRAQIRLPLLPAVLTSLASLALAVQVGVLGYWVAGAVVLPLALASVRENIVRLGRDALAGTGLVRTPA